MAVRLPGELVFMEILPRLPVKSLLKLRCVSKSWNSFISSLSFITAQVSRTLLVAETTTTSRRALKHKNYYHCPYEDNIPGCRLEYKSFQAGGYCNGVICLMTTERCFDDLVLWNPSIRKSLRLPPANFSGQTYGFYPAVIGFGFDSVNNDYKVVRIVIDSKIYKGDNIQDRLPVQVELYSLNSGSWKIIHDFLKPNWIHIIYNHYDHAYLNDAVHWHALDDEENGKKKSIVLSFDLSSELFKKIMLPECLATSMASVISVSNKFLEVFQCDYGFYHVWVMKEYGVEESWSKELVIDLRRRIPFCKVIEKVSCDPQSHEICNLEILRQENECTCGADPYTESLVLLNKI